MKKTIAMLLAAAMCVSLAACTGNTSVSTSDSSQTSSIITSILEEEPVSVSVSDNKADTSVSTSTGTSTSVEAEPEEIREGYVRSDLTNEWIPAELENQRPVAIMVDNEKTALPHYGTSDSDIVYEMMNSTKNDRITRLMCIVKDWKNIERFGNIRSTRSTNIILAPEYNAILVHDGGPSIYINQWFSEKICKQHLSGGFARFDNGKAWTYKEFVTANSYKGIDKSKNEKTYSGLISRIEKAGYETEYNKYYLGKHFTFSGSDYTLTGSKKVTTAKDITLPFPHNSTELHYNEDTKTYDYYEYGSLYIDALYGDENRRMSFKNVFILKCGFEQFDENGYLCYYILGSDTGYYLTNGEAIPITWKKDNLETLMTFKDSDGNDIVLNTGKTYIAIVPADSWKKLGME